MDTSNQGRTLASIEDDKLKEAVAKGEVRLKNDPDEGKTDIGSADSYPDGEKPELDTSHDSPPAEDHSEPKDAVPVKAEKIGE